MKTYVLIGEKLGHSLSVPIHQAIFRRLGLDASYRLQEIAAGQFEEATAQLLREVDGMNVTIPYKQRILPLLDGLDPMAAQAGAVNTVVCHAGKLTGYNTDIFGFETMLRMNRIQAAQESCFILGTGGAARAVAVALQDMGAQEIVFVSRHPQPGQIGYNELRERFHGLLINCTPVGMYPHAGLCPVPDPVLQDMLPVMSGCVDLIYNPPETELTARCRASGIPVCSGLSMLVAQALEAERLWQNTEIPAEMIDDILQEMIP